MERSHSAPKGRWTSFEDKGAGPGISYAVEGSEGEDLTLACAAPGRIEVYVPAERPPVIPLIRLSSGAVSQVHMGRRSNYEDAYFAKYAVLSHRERVLAEFQRTGRLKADKHEANATSDEERRTIADFFARCR